MVISEDEGNGGGESEAKKRVEADGPPKSKFAAEKPRKRETWGK